ncbi:MAG: class I SAM-dependent methyltransferase [Spirochaetales bacterium]|nr:class I SAM-dependent methyltransferase [Spirochaetales bacterium]
MEPKTDNSICPLCSENKIDFYFKDRIREYFLCTNCGLVFVPPLFHLNMEEEKSRYDLHQNNPEDEGYRKFLSRFADPLCDRLKSGQTGLDFGCGPGPVLSILLKRKGYPMSLYDPFYYNDPSILENTFDFITATEVAEHFSSPGMEFKHLFGMIKRGGLLGLMTMMVSSKDAFGSWYYIQDQTHICFYSIRTFEYLAGIYNTNLEIIGKDVIFMERKHF